MIIRTVAIMWLIVALLVQSTFAQQFSYFPPGELFPGSGEGRTDDRTIYYPGLSFPLRVGIQANGAQAYIGSQIFNIRGGGANAVENYAYPWRDNYCEARLWDMPMCPGATGHQGVDIRPSNNQNATWEAVAMADGVVTQVTDNTTVTVRSDGGYYCRYLHLNKASIRAAAIALNVRVQKGVTVLGKVSNIMGGTPNTSIHLHFDCYKRVADQIVRFPVYSSLIAGYRDALGLPTLVSGNQFGVDPEREVHGDATPPGEAGCPPFGMSIGTESAYRFASLWTHNCSLMGLVVEGTIRKFVYVRPSASVRSLVAADPVLFEGNYLEGAYRGVAKSYSSQCGAAGFDASGPVSSDLRGVTVSGARPMRDNACATTDTRLTELQFAYFGQP